MQALRSLYLRSPIISVKDDAKIQQEIVLKHAARCAQRRTQIQISSKDRVPIGSNKSDVNMSVDSKIEAAAEFHREISRVDLEKLRTCRSGAVETKVLVGYTRKYVSPRLQFWAFLLVILYLNAAHELIYILACLERSRRYQGRVYCNEIRVEILAVGM